MIEEQTLGSGMDLYNSTKVRLRVAPHCRGAASSMLRLSNTAPSGFGGLGRSGSLALRLAQSVPMSPFAPDRSGDAEHGAARADRPLYTRLWPSVSFGHEALWQDTLVALD